MRLKFLFIFTLISLGLLHSQESFNIENILKESTFDYYTDKDGDFIINYKTRTNRDQVVIIRNDTNQFQNIYVREVLSIARTYLNTPIPESLSNYLLIDNYATKYLGNWAVHKKNNISTILFLVKLPSDSKLELLEAAIIESAEAADALEQALEDEIENSLN